MLEEGRKLRIASKAADLILAAAAAATMAQGAQHFASFGAVQAPGVVKGQEEGRKRGEAERNLDSGRVSHPARNRMKKTFKEFVEEAYLYEMNKQKKMAGKQKTPLTLPVTTTRKHVEKDENGNWKVKKVDTVTQGPNPAVGLGRYVRGDRGMPGDPVSHNYSTEGGTSGGPGFGYHKERSHSTGGALRGVKKIPGEKKPPEWQPGVDSRTPAKKVEDKRKKAAYLKSGGYNWKRYGG
jgi:hypothetical protein